MKPLSNRIVLVTAGPTREPLDPVRYMTNPSSGRMGLEIARALRRAGAKVVLVSGPTAVKAPTGVQSIPVVTGVEMSRAVKPRLRSADAFIATAAVCDWRFDKPKRFKMKKGAQAALKVVLRRNPDILAEAGAARRRGRTKALLVGFSLETHRAERFANEKLRRKNLDLIIANSPASFASDRILPMWIERPGVSQRLPSMTKSALSRRIVAWLAGRLEGESHDRR